MRPRQWFNTRLEALRSAPSRGATLVEYALVFSLLVVVSLGAVEFLNDSASNEIDNQAGCISDRPPPDSGCSFAALPEGLEVPDPGFSPPTSAPPVEADRPTVVLTTRSENTGVWQTFLVSQVSKPVITDPPSDPLPLPGVTVAARVETHAGDGVWAEIIVMSCVTGPDGACELLYTPSPAEQAVRYRIVNVASNPPPDPLPGVTSAINRP